MSTNPAHFRLVAVLPGGHRLFESDRPGMLAIADRSGDTPPQTDDGTLYVDTRSPIQVGRGQIPGSIPLVTSDGRATRTLCSAADVLALAVITGQEIASPAGTLYRVAQVTS